MSNIPAPNKPLGSLEEINSLLGEIFSLGQNLDLSHPESREQLIEKSRKLTGALETPLEAILWMMWSEPARTFASRIALDLKLFTTLVEDGGRAKTVAELAKPTNADPMLVHRIARKLSSMDMIHETGEGVYAPNALTRVLSIPKYSEGIIFCYDATGPSFVKMAQFFEEKGFHNPIDPATGPFRYAQGEDPWLWLNDHPRIFAAFQAYVHGQREDRPTWTDEGFYPVQERLIQGSETSDGSEPTIVDVGGGVGHVLLQFKEDVKWQGRLVLQEQEPVIRHALATGLNAVVVEPMIHDFFKLQPVKGARAYHMRYILHDWTDDKSLEILSHLKQVMKPGYSKILLNEQVLADQGASWQAVSLDLFMMGLTCSFERTKKQWYALIEQAGLKIAGIWTKGTGNESLIEVVLPED